MENGARDLLRDNRPVALDLDDMDEALAMIRRQDPTATTITVIEEDGYHTHTRL